MTERNLATNGPNGTRSERIFVPLLFVTTTVLVAGCLRSAGAADVATTAIAQPTPVALPTSTPVPAPGLGADDPRLGMNVLTGNQVATVRTAYVQVLPGGNVDTDSAPSKLKVSPTIETHWVKNSAPTTLWSGPDASASAFTDVPEDSFFRVTGPEQGSRTPVYYVGDGLFRQAGNGWVDTDEVSTVDAPPPGQVSAVDADARQPLPTWVEAHTATNLWSGPDDKAVKLTDLPQWTFLKVAGLERDGRLLVNFAGDYANRQPGIGWVDQKAVGPAGDPGVWLSNFRATALWSGVDDKAVKFTDLPQWSKVRIVEGALVDAKRIQVEFFGDGFTRQPGPAWIARGDVGPITPPVPLPTIPIKIGPGAQQMEQHTFNSTSDFITVVGAAAQKSARVTGVPASVTVAQAILESDWGRSRLSRNGNNLFGIKALNGAGPAGVVTMATWEYTPSGDVIVQAAFKAYYTLEQSIDDHGKFFTQNRRYAAALAVAKDARAFAQKIQDAGYATDPSYASKLIGLMDRYNLYRFDT